ncbi:MAG: thiol-disulfide isomerase [Candidatus Ryanbacteria bacterium CG10_big_fil_rev_8_21_14_0_10_43_42]|uniref:Thiol-disulfide isomerase n=1 Tax=Candidatus Ryanbacteria bacterium CG10_big_fil_rev_8_21_14_0_10_43_42 TaxID=1974864 RepID=A0A2M8KXP6_9BACT|nr:MAG: thiol-disulfide isomerase [Candidatus Ryanbacteria bacterium CG10_big_fil_rev_8_21_14_0_10_43_42]
MGVIIFLESGKVDMVKIQDGLGDLNISLFGTDDDSSQDRIQKKQEQYEFAKEISTPDGFINTDGSTIEELIGEKIILVDFWTYSCINCQRTIPYLNSWHEKYADEGLVILGIHTPEFEFEKEYANVKRAVEQFGIMYPVILDNDFSTWQSYKNRYWPRKYLIDIDGFIVYDHIGEGGYNETEEKIVELLNERRGVLGEQGNVSINTASPVGVESITDVRTPETYLGAKRVEYLANLPSEKCISMSCTYEVRGEIEQNTFQLQGVWQLRPEESTLISGEGSLFLHFFAGKVNVVAGSETPVEAELYLDGKRVEDEFAGAHVKNGSVIFQNHDLYNLIDLKGDAGAHILEIRVKKSGLSAFAFTFG